MEKLKHFKEVSISFNKQYIENAGLSQGFPGDVRTFSQDRILKTQIPRLP